MFTKVPAQITFRCDGCGCEESVAAPTMQLVPTTTFLPEHWRSAIILHPSMRVPAELSYEFCPNCIEQARAALRALAK